MPRLLHKREQAILVVDAVEMSRLLQTQYKRVLASKLQCLIFYAVGA